MTQQIKVFAGKFEDPSLNFWTQSRRESTPKKLFSNFMHTYMSTNFKNKKITSNNTM